MDAEPTPDQPIAEEALRAELRLSSSPIVRWLFVIGGTTSLVLGLIGLFLPIVPTTPFLLLTAFCYARGSERFYRWLLTNKYFGSYIRAWRNNEGVPIKVKVYALALLWYVLTMSAIFVVPLWQVRVLFFLVGAGVTIYIVRLPTRRS